MIHLKINDNHRKPGPLNGLLANFCFKAFMFSEKQPKSRIIFTKSPRLLAYFVALAEATTA
jgi:hypothetical protein